MRSGVRDTAGQPILRGALKFAALAAPLSWSFMALAASAKHHMASPFGYLGIETCFITLHDIVVSPTIATVYRERSPSAGSTPFPHPD